LRRFAGSSFGRRETTGMQPFWSFRESNRNKQNKRERNRMNWTVATYLTYLAISISLTVWVARTLHKNGRVFLVESFQGNEELADSVNHLLVVGFYLVNVGFVTLALKYGAMTQDAQGLLERLSTKVGLVLLVLGFMHFFNLAIFSKMRRRGAIHRTVPPVLA
jgi:hypothetical protein